MKITDELVLCRQDIEYFIQSYVTVNNSKIVLSDIQKEFIKHVKKQKMSYVELHTGTLTKINTDGFTVEEYCESLCKKHGYEITYEGDTYAETLRDVDDTYKVLNGELYRCDDTQYPEDTSYLVDVRSNGDGTYEYIAQFYNGSTYLDEVLEDGIKNTLK